MKLNIPYSFICIEGNIGAGKTSFATQLSNDLSSRIILEQFADNPFLPKFYNNPERYAFPLELSFMAERYRQFKHEIESIELFNPQTVSDYVFYKCLIFASVNLQEDEVKLYKSLFHIIYQNIPAPEIILFLHCETNQLLKNIQKRGRAYEKSITAEYLQSVNDMYFEFFKHQDKSIILVLNTTNLNFVDNNDIYMRICKLLEKQYSIGIHYVDIDTITP